MALAAKRGKGRFSSKIQEIADSMTEKQLRDFAKTKHKGLPEKKAYIEGFMKRAAEYGLSEQQAKLLFKKASAGYGDLKLEGFDKDGTPIADAKTSPGIMAHLNRNAGKYIGGLTGTGVLAAMSANGLPFGSFLASYMPYLIGETVDEHRKINHIKEMIKNPENVEKLFQK